MQSIHASTCQHLPAPASTLHNGPASCFISTLFLLSMFCRFACQHLPAPVSTCQHPPTTASTCQHLPSVKISAFSFLLIKIFSQKIYCFFQELRLRPHISLDWASSSSNCFSKGSGPFSVIPMDFISPYSLEMIIPFLCCGI